MRAIAAHVAGVILLLGAAGGAGAAIEVYDFDNPVQEAAFKELVAELRCLVCQNQNIADSNADLAQDLRAEIYKMLKGGAGKDEIVDFMVARYGDFVLYRPPVRASTALLWFGPFLIGVVGLYFLIRFIRGRAVRPAAAGELSAAERERLDSLLAGEGERKDS